MYMGCAAWIARALLLKDLDVEQSEVWHVITGMANVSSQQEDRTVVQQQKALSILRPFTINCLEIIFLHGQGPATKTGPSSVQITIAKIVIRHEDEGTT